MNNHNRFVARKLFHMAFFFIIIIYANPSILDKTIFKFYLKEILSVFFAILFLLHLLWEKWRIYSVTLEKLYQKIAGIFLKEREKEKKELPGSLWLLLSHFFIIFFFSRETSILALIPLVIGDPAAALVGKYFPIKKFSSGKSIGGFFFGLGTSFLICIIIIYHYDFHLYKNTFSFIWIFVAYLAAFIAELSVTVINDNLSIPFISAIGIYILEISLTVN